jgi:hypothetical protein
MHTIRYLFNAHLFHHQAAVRSPSGIRISAEVEQMIKPIFTLW